MPSVSTPEAAAPPLHPTPMIRRVAWAAALAAALGGTISAMVSGLAAAGAITAAEDAALLRATRDFADEIHEELLEAPEDDSPDERAHFARHHGPRTLQNLLVHEAEQIDLPGIQATVRTPHKHDTSPSRSLPPPVGSCADNASDPRFPRRECAVAFDAEGAVLVLSVIQPHRPHRPFWFAMAILSGTLSGVLVGGWASFVGARWVVRPIDALRERLDGIHTAMPSVEALDPPLPEVELEELRLAVVSLVARLGAALDTARTFASHAAHELRTPLTSLSAEIDLWAQDVERPPPPQRLRQQVDTLIALVHRLLALGTAEADLASTGVAIDLGELVMDTVAQRSATQRARLDVSTQEVTVRGDEHLLAIMLANGLDNALKFSTGSVHVHVHTDHTHARVDVVDHGPGLDPADAAHVFEPFFRSRTARSSNTPGHGIGLALIRHVADAHGGHADLERLDDDTTRLRITLPCWRPAPIPSGIHTNPETARAT